MRPSSSHAGAGPVALGLAAVLTCCSDLPREIVLASTTSTLDSGLFDVLIPEFESSHSNYRVRVVAVGSGEALRLGARGDADALLVHSPAAEERFMDDGYGESRHPVMYNDFVIVGPPEDPAGIRGMPEAAPALMRIAETTAAFVSRGDDSGTHNRERSLWRGLEVDSWDRWYLEAGQGMSEVLVLASEKGAYTLADRGTYLSLRERLLLDILVEGDPALHNQYSVIVVQGAINASGARAFAGWIRSPDAQELIGDFGRDRFGQPLFHPNAAYRATVPST